MLVSISLMKSFPTFVTVLHHIFSFLSKLHLNCSILTYAHARAYAQHVVKDKERDAELKKLRAQSAENKEQVHSLKEENSRKALLLAKMKETKLADNETIDKRTKDAADNEATAKRSARAFCQLITVL